ncbi:MAG: tetratricopeptide repeat protein [Anaerolineales bacterium]|nr:tetratricopeptide repeat protein [Anaerolineales bacterium]
MARNTLRVFGVLALLALAIVVPLVSSGYYELHQAARSNSYSEAAGHYQTAAQRLPWRADLYELVGHAYYHAREYRKASDAYQKAFALRALSPAGWMAWGDVNYLNEDPERARQIWEEALKQEDPSDELYSRLAEIYQSRGEPARAAEYLQNYVSAHPQDASGHYRLGLLLILSDPERASTELIDAARLDPQFDPAVQTLRTALNVASLNDAPSGRFVILGRGLGLVNEWQLAGAAFEAAVEADGKNAEAWAWLGEARQHTGLPEGGNAELEQALSLDPNSAAVRGLRGLYFQRAGDFRQALTEFKAAAALEPENPTWFVSIGESYAKLGDLIRALESYQAATILAPDDANTWRLLAIFCAQNNVHISDVGLPAAEKVVVLTQADTTTLDLLGWMLALAANYDQAEQKLVRALELDPQNASAHLHLGMLYLQTDERPLAYEHFIQARDLGNEDARVFLNQYFP